MLIASHYIDVFKLDVYVSQLYFNVTKQLDILYSTKVPQWKVKQIYEQPEIHQGFLTKLCHLYLSPMKCIISLQLSKSFHAGLISRSFSQPKFCTIRQSNLLCTSCSIRIVTYITYLNVYIILTILNYLIEPYTPIKCVAMTV